MVGCVSKAWGTAGYFRLFQIPGTILRACDNEPRNRSPDPKKRNPFQLQSYALIGGGGGGI